MVLYNFPVDFVFKTYIMIYLVKRFLLYLVGGGLVGQAACCGLRHCAAISVKPAETD